MDINELNNLNDALQKAQSELFQKALDLLANPDDDSIHNASAIAATAGLAGTKILRNSGIDLSKHAPGQTIVCDYVEKEGPALYEYAGNAFAEHDIDFTVAGSIDIPPDCKPLKPITILVRKIEKAADEIFAKHRLPKELHPNCAALAGINMVLASVVQGFDPDIGAAIFAMAIMEGSKTCPAAALL